MKLFTGRAHPALAKRICEYLGLPLGRAVMGNFPDGEISCKIDEDVRGRDVFLLQPTCPPVNESLMELLIMIESFKRASADRITAVIPYFGYARQDRKDEGRVPITAKLVANLIARAGADRVLAMDLHTAQIQGFFDVPVDHLYASRIFIPYIESLKLENLVIASPDVGGSKRAGTYSRHLDVPMVLCHKTREKANVVGEMRIIGEVEGKDVIIVDDMVDTAGTLCMAADLMMAAGAKSVRAIVTHGVMSGPASEKIMKSALNEIAFTDSIPFDCKRCEKVKILSCADMFADTIERVQTHRSISEQYIIK